MAIRVSALETRGAGGNSVIGLLSILLHDVYRGLPSESGFPGSAAARYKLSIAEFERQLAGLWAVRKDVPLLMTKEARPGAGDPRFAITVDDGGVSYYTIVADRLEALGWRGHCFVTTGAIGQRGFLDAKQIRELHSRGHVIGSHSVSHHLRFSACRWEDMQHEWCESRDVLAGIIGEEVTAASVPGGAFSSRVARAACAAGFRLLFTSEPETRISVIDACTVLGRFTIRAGCKSDFSSRLGRLEPATRATEWFIWNAKQGVKTFFVFAAPQRNSRRMVNSLPSTNQPL